LGEPRGESILAGDLRNACSGPWKFYTANGTLRPKPAFQDLGAISGEALVVPAADGSKGTMDYALDLAWEEDGVSVDLHADFDSPIVLVR
jgi:hypothetical protein